MGGKAKYLLRGRKRPPTFPWCQTVGGPFRALSGARKCLPTKPGHGSGAATAGAGRRYWFRWLMRPWRGIVPKKSQLGEDRCNFKPRRTDHTEEEHRPTRADSNH